MNIEIHLQFRITKCTKNITSRVRKYLQSTTFLKDTTAVLQSGSFTPDHINHFIYFKAHDAKLNWNKHLIILHVYGVYKTHDPVPIPHGLKEIQKEFSEIFAHKAFSGFYGKFDDQLWTKHNVTLNFPKAKVTKITLLPKLKVNIPKQYSKVCPVGSKCFQKMLVPPSHVVTKDKNIWSKLKDFFIHLK